MSEPKGNRTVEQSSEGFQYSEISRSRRDLVFLTVQCLWQRERVCTWSHGWWRWGRVVGGGWWGAEESQRTSGEDSQKSVEEENNLQKQTFQARPIMTQGRLVYNSTASRRFVKISCPVLKFKIALTRLPWPAGKEFGPQHHKSPTVSYHLNQHVYVCAGRTEKDSV